MYRLVRAQWLTVDRFDDLSIDDVREACTMLDAIEDADRRANKS